MRLVWNVLAYVLSFHSGGGIFNGATTTLNDSTVSGGSANSGGGIYIDDTLTLNTSTLSGNAADNEGGGIPNVGAALTSHPRSTYPCSDGSLGKGKLLEQGTSTSA